jgi:hypothetical protein
MRTCYTLNSTVKDVAETVATLYKLGLKCFMTDSKHLRCLAVWDDLEFTTLYDHALKGASDLVDVNKVYNNSEEFLEVIKKELLNLPKEKEVTNVAANVVQTNTNLSISELTDLIHTGNVKAGWWTNLETGEDLTSKLGDKPKRNIPEMLCLIHSEVSEAMEGHRKNLMDDKLPHRPMLEVELADAVIRILDMCGGLGLDLQGAIYEKLAYNAQRADHKVENRLKENGKKF